MSKPSKASKAKRRGNQVRAKTAKPPVVARAGRPHTKPLVILYREGVNTVCAKIVRPGSDSERLAASTGIYSALGTLMDDGYKFGHFRPWQSGIPDWALARVPKGCKALGYRSNEHNRRDRNHG